MTDNRILPGIGNGPLDLGQVGERVSRPFSRDRRQLNRLNGPKMILDSQVRTEEPGKSVLPVFLQTAVKNNKTLIISQLTV